MIDEFLLGTESRIQKIPETPVEFLEEYGIGPAPELDEYVRINPPPPIISIREGMSP